MRLPARPVPQGPPTGPGSGNGRIGELTTPSSRLGYFRIVANSGPLSPKSGDDFLFWCPTGLRGGMDTVHKNPHRYWSGRPDHTPVTAFRCTASLNRRPLPPQE